MNANADMDGSGIMNHFMFYECKHCLGNLHYKARVHYIAIMPAHTHECIADRFNLVNAKRLTDVVESTKHEMQHLNYIFGVPSG